MNNTVLKDRLSQAISSSAKDTSLVSTDEAARMCGMASNKFATARTKKWPDVLQPAKKDGIKKYYRVCDVEYFLVILRNQDENGEFEISHGDLASKAGIGETTLKKYLNYLYQTELLHRQLRLDRKLGNIANIYKLGF